MSIKEEYYFLSNNLLYIIKNTAAARMVAIPSVPKELVMEEKFSATDLGKGPDFSPSRKNSTNPAEAIARPNSVIFQIKEHILDIVLEYDLILFSIFYPYIAFHLNNYK